MLIKIKSTTKIVDQKWSTSQGQKITRSLQIMIRKYFNLHEPQLLT